MPPARAPDAPAEFRACPAAPPGSSRAGRFRFGKELRERLPRSRHGRWQPPREREDPVALLQRVDRDRLARLLPVRYARMATTAFTFFRGSAAIMAADLSTTPTSSLAVQTVGDAHVANFGVFATPERDRVFDVNDFDETLPGPWEWDVKRLATGLVLVAAEHRYGAKVGRQAVRAASRSYRRHLLRFAWARYLDTWYAHLDRSAARSVLGPYARKLLDVDLAHARRRTGFKAFPRLVRTRDGHAAVRAEPPLVAPYRAGSEADEARRVLEAYRRALPPERRLLLDRYRLVDVAEKVVGVGSVGTRCSVALLLGDEDVRDPVFLQVKQALPAVGEAYLGPCGLSPSERVVVGQRSVQEASDALLGRADVEGRSYYVRQLRDMKFASEVSALRPRALRAQAELCGYALARAHARTGDPARIAGYVGEGDALDRALVDFAERYARQVVRDHAEFQRAVRAGRLPSAAGES